VRHPCRTPNGLFPPKAPVLGAAYGIKSTPPAKFSSLSLFAWERDNYLHVYAGYQAPALVVMHKCLWDTVIPAGIAGVQSTGMWMLDLIKQLRVARLVASFSIAIYSFWIPAIPAGMTSLKILVRNDERGRMGRA